MITKKIIFLFLISIGTMLFSQNNPGGKLIAVTVDDLLINGPDKDTKSIEEMTISTLDILKANSITAVGFVNEEKLFTNNDEARRTQILKLWLDYGMELANHTYSHLSLNEAPLEEYKKNFLKGEVVTNQLLSVQNKKATYFRHPYLHTGTSIETKKAFDNYLSEHGYRIAPVTIENSDWCFASVYRRAMANSDSALMKSVATSYLQFTKDIFDFSEMLTEKLFGRQIKQVFLFHANELNADYLDELIAIIKSYGYSFTTLDDALTDDAYKLPDNFVGKYGPTWPQRWALERGLKDILVLEPDIPANIKQLFDDYK